ncbi:MAG: hypothetical protein KDC34_05160 [Saprospiraceae bacterium]|nr:hypothetical protein [Saprospiraceae bacterium]
MYGIRLIFSTSILFLALNSLQAQSFTSNPLAQDDLPKVFVLGDHEAQYEELLISYEQSLLQVCDLDMDKAFNVWMSMVEELEAYATTIDYDINGIRAWFHVFFDSDGSVDHIAFHLKPQSRNVDLDEFTAFLSSFINLYKVPMTTTNRYFNYTSVAFPSHYQQMKGEGN